MRREVKKVLHERTGSYGSFGENATFTQSAIRRLGRPSVSGLYDDFVLSEAAHMIYHKLGRIHIGGDIPSNQDSFVDNAGYAFVCARHMLSTHPNWEPDGGEGALDIMETRGNRALELVDAAMPTIFQYTDRIHVGQAMLHLGQRLQALVDK